jgi:endonuclease/exonuclease/phosphatase family metal-dependent hydrolase
LITLPESTLTTAIKGEDFHHYWQHLRNKYDWVGLGENAQPDSFSAKVFQAIREVSVSELGRTTLWELAPYLKNVFISNASHATLAPLNEGTHVSLRERICSLAATVGASLSNVRERDHLLDKVLKGIGAFSFSAITFNIFGIPGVNRQVMQRLVMPNKDYRFNLIRERISAEKFDVVSLQEVWSKRALLAIPLFKEKEMQEDYFQKVRLLRGNGLVTVSPHKILNTNFYSFKAVGGIERLVKKGVLHSTVFLPCGEIIDIFNVHLLSEPERINKLFLSERKWHRLRRLQLEELRELVASKQYPGASCTLILGDFNIADCDTDYLKLCEYFGADLYQISAKGKPNQEVKAGYTFEPKINPLAKNPKMAPERIDYIFAQVNGGFRGMVSSDRIFVNENLSDHYGVTAKLFILS